MHWIVEPGFFSSPPVRVALVIGAVVAVVSAVVGVFTVMRSQSFAGHTLTDVSTAGGAGAVLVGISPLFGFVGSGLVGAGAMDVIGVQRARGRDLATGIVLGAATGLAALFLYLDTTTRATTGVTQQILFGSIFTVDSSLIPVVVVFGALSVAIILAVYRPLLLSSISADMAVARGVALRPVGLLFMAALAVSVGLAALVVGSILSTALLIGPAATALRMAARVGWAMVVAGALGVGATWLGILLSYDSFYWDASHQGLPVSFFIVAVVVVLYLLSGLPRLRSGRAGDRVR